MKNLKSLIPHIILNAIINAVIGAVIGKVTIEILNTKKRINSDYEALRKFLKDMGGKATHIKLEELEKTGDGDDHKPIKPVPIYIYD